MATILQSHHVIEASEFEKHDLLKALVRENLIDPDASANRIYLPYEKDFADRIETAPHRGKTDSTYTLALRNNLSEILKEHGGDSVLNNKAALQRALPDIHELMDTLKVGMVHRKVFPSLPENMSRDEARALNLKSLSDLEQIRIDHAADLTTLRSMGAVESEWIAVTHSEQRIMQLVDKVYNGPLLLVRAPGDAPERDVVGRREFYLAISQTEASGRVTLSEANAALVKQVLVDDLPSIGRAPHGVYDLTKAPAINYKPLSQRGFATMEALIGELPLHTAMRLGGTAATGLDLYQSLHRAAELNRQDNPEAAKSELEHFAARNVGGWAGGAAAYLAGAPAALVAETAVVATMAAERAMDVRDYQRITHLTDRNQVNWEFNGRVWTREGRLDPTPGVNDAPVQADVVADYAKMRELNAEANAQAASAALRKAPTGEDPFDLPAKASDQIGIDNPNWTRNPQTEQWQRVVKTSVSGANDRGKYEEQIATSERAAELNQEAMARIVKNVLAGRESIAALYQEQHLAQRADEVATLSPAVEAALPKADVVVARDGQAYRRNAEGVWSSGTTVAQGNLAAELELTRLAREPFLEAHQQRVAQLEAQPKLTPEQKQQEELAYRYRVAGIELEPGMPEAITLAMQRTRQAHGLTGPGVTQLQLPEQPQAQRDKTGQIIRGGVAAASVPIVHYQRDAQGVNQRVAVTDRDEILQALKEVQARQQQAPIPDSPELRVAQQSPQEREAYAQALREANRQGLSTEQAQEAAVRAAAALHAGGDSAQQTPQVVGDAERTRGPETGAVPPEGSRRPPVEPAEVAARTAVPDEPRSQERSPAPDTAAPATAPASANPVPPQQQTAGAPALTAAALAGASAVVPEPSRRIEPASAPQPATPDLQERSEASPRIEPSARAESPATPPMQEARQPAPAVPVAPEARTPEVQAARAPSVSPSPDPDKGQSEPAVAAKPERPQPEGLRRGDQGPEVEFLQYRLQRAGATGPDGRPVPQDGTYGVETEHAVRQVQQAQGLPVTGVADRALDEALAQPPALRPDVQPSEPTATIVPGVQQTAPPTGTEAPPEQAIERSAADERQARAQVVAEAQRQGASPAEVQQAASLAAQDVRQGATGLEALAQPDSEARSYQSPLAPGRMRQGAWRDAEPDALQEQAAPEQARLQAFPTDHRDYELFAVIQAHLPKGTPDDKTAEIMHEAKERGVVRADQFEKVGYNSEGVYILGKTLGFHTGTISLSSPAPEIETTLKRTEALDQRRAEELAQFRAEQEEIAKNRTGPTMTLGMAPGGAGDGGGGDAGGGGGE